jgi:hypothetical protein
MRPQRLMRVASAFTFVLVTCLVVACEKKIIKQENNPGTEEGLPEGERESVKCAKAGDPTAAVNAFDTTPGTEADGLVCDLGNVLDDDGNITGLSRPGASKGTMLGREVNGCVGVKFGDGNTISSLIMKMRPISGLCGHSCTQGGENGCGTGWKVQVFVGPSFEKIQWLQQISLTKPEMFEYRVAVHRTYAAQYAIVCREATPETGDDIAIDSISGLCDEPPK